MSAVVYQFPTTSIPGPAFPRPVVLPQPDSQQAVFWRRRAIALVVAIGLLFAAGSLVNAVAHAAFSSEPAPTAAAVAGQPQINHSYEVQAGDTLWSIVSQVHPGTDPRPIVKDMQDTLGSASLQIGDVIYVP